MIDEEALKRTFRAQELKARENRRRHFLATLRNEAALEHEGVNAVDFAAHTDAIESLIRQQLRFEKETTPSYWRRLWNALLNK